MAAAYPPVFARNQQVDMENINPLTGQSSLLPYSWTQGGAQGAVNLPLHKDAGAPQAAPSLTKGRKVLGDITAHHQQDHLMAGCQADHPMQQRQFSLPLGHQQVTALPHMMPQGAPTLQGGSSMSFSRTGSSQLRKMR